VTVFYLLILLLIRGQDAKRVIDKASLHPAPCTLNPAPCTLHPAPCTLNPTPCRSSEDKMPNASSTRQAYIQKRRVIGGSWGGARRVIDKACLQFKRYPCNRVKRYQTRHAQGNPTSRNEIFLLSL
jgi:hypothetical protein